MVVGTLGYIGWYTDYPLSSLGLPWRDWYIFFLSTSLILLRSVCWYSKHIVLNKFNGAWWFFCFVGIHCIIQPSLFYTLNPARIFSKYYGNFFIIRLRYLGWNPFFVEQGGAEKAFGNLPMATGWLRLVLVQLSETKPLSSWFWEEAGVKLR